MALRLKESRHFVRDVAAEAVSAERIRPGRLEGPQFLHIARRHLLDGLEAILSGRPIGAKHIHGLVGAEMPGKIEVAPQHAAADAMHQLNQPYGIAVDGSGNVFVADTFNRAVRKITAGGEVSTLGGPNARFYYAQGIAVGGSGNLYVADGDNQAILKGVFVAAPPSGTPVASVAVTTGQNASFTLGAPNSQTTYLWQVSTDAGATWTSLNNNATYSGTTTTTLNVTNLTTAMNGSRYRALLANAAGTSVSGTATLAVTSPLVGIGPTGTARLINVSVRTFVGTGDSTMAVGFGISGTGSKQLLVRGVGPTLAVFGVDGVLGNPVLGLYNSSSVVMDTNAGWGGGATLANAFSSMGAFALPASSADAALFRSLPAGATYSALISGANSTTGTKSSFCWLILLNASRSASKRSIVCAAVSMKLA